jgi:drug/metabolite transporter (DMT)-like permease
MTEQSASPHHIKFEKSVHALLMMVGAHFCFSIMIALIKAAQQLQYAKFPNLPATARFGTWESVLFRCLPMTFICLIVFIKRTNQGKKHPRLTLNEIRWLITRGVIGAVSMACFFYGTLHIPIALASLFANSSVFMIGLLGHYFLSERMTPARAFFALAGFLGVTLVLGTGFLPAQGTTTVGHASEHITSAQRATDYLIAFLSGVLASIAYFSVRKMKKVPGNTIILSLSLSGVFLALIAGLVHEPLSIPDDPAVLALLCLSGIPAVIAQYLMTWSFQSAEAGFVALGQYTGPVFAAILGIVAFDESLSALQWLGAAVTLCFGVMMPLVELRKGNKRESTEGSACAPEERNPAT